jgi:hypothetical protein
MEHVRQHDTFPCALGDVPCRPADEPVDRVPLLGLRQAQLMVPSGELVAAVLQSVRPRDQDLPAAGRAYLVRGVAVEHVLAVDAVRTDAAADLDDDDALPVVDQLDLLA